MEIPITTDVNGNGRVTMMDSVEVPQEDVAMTEATRLLTPIEGIEVEASGQHRLVISHFSQIKDTKRYTEEFELAGHRWRVLMFPRGNRCDSLSLYLDYCDPRRNTPNWCCCAHFSMTLSNPIDPTVAVTKEAQHRFHQEESDWGFTQFMKLGQFHNESHVPGRDFLHNDSFVISISLNIVKDTTGQLWRDFLNYDSKRETGHVGLKNQGATCYMNSILQSLFFTKFLRRAVFKMPTLNDEVGKSVPLALQRLFYQLQKSDTAVGTTELTKSFGWDTLDSFMQHDVQEFNRVLCDNLETKMKNTSVEGVISQLFEGKMKSFIKCMHVPYESSRVESFYDIQLNVKGLKTVSDAFKDYVSVETMEGDNKYFAEGFGLQDAKKGVTFQSFPPVLHLQLKRFEYDLQRDMMVKINDRFEFPLVIDLDEFMNEDMKPTDKEPDSDIGIKEEADNGIKEEVDGLTESNNVLQPSQTLKETTTVKQRYHLHAVLVHAGDVNSGHYCTFIRPDKEGQWYKFDDDRVTVASEREAVMDNYGDSDVLQNTTTTTTPMVMAGGARPLKSLHKRFTNAYMLVYIRESDLDRILCTVTDDDMPAHLRERFDRERALDEQRRKEKEEQHLFVRVNVATETIMQRHSGIDLVNFDDKNHPKSDIISLRLRKDMTVLSLKEILLPHFLQQQSVDVGEGILHQRESTFFKDELRVIGLENIALYVMVGRQNKTLRPSQPELMDEDQLSLVTEERSKYPAELRLFCEFKHPARMLELQNNILIVLKLFDPIKDHLYVLTTLHVSPHIKPSEIAQWLHLHLSPSMASLLFGETAEGEEELLCFEEVRPTMVSLLKWSMSLSSQEISDGDILIFQKNQQQSMNTVVGYFDRLVNRIVVRFREKVNPNYSNVPAINGTPNPPTVREDVSSPQPNEREQSTEISLNLNKKMTYEDVTAVLAKAIAVDPSKLRLYCVNSYTDSPKSPVKRSMSLQEMLQPSYYAPPTDLLYYEVLTMSLTELENKRSIKIIHEVDGEEVTFELLLNKQATVQDALNALSERIQLSQTGQLRLLEIFNNKIMRQYDATASIDTLTEYGTLLAVEISRDEIHRRIDKDPLVTVSHYHRDPFRCFGVPFVFVLKSGETLRELRVRLGAYLKLSEKEMEKVKITVVTQGKAQVLEDEEESLVDTMFPSAGSSLLPRTFSVDPEAPYLGLDHADKSGKLHKNGSFERSIVIKN